MTYSQFDFENISRTRQSRRFDYSHSVFTGVCNKVRIRCMTHDLIFEQRAEHHMHGRNGCPKCRGEMTTMVHGDTKATFVEKAVGLHGQNYKYNLIEDTLPLPFKIQIVCPRHGVFVQARQDHLQGKGCRGCAIEGRKRGYKETEWFGRRVRYQGYEILGATYLVKEKGIKSSDIQFSMDGKGIPVIKYLAKNTMHKHYPDIWIPTLDRLVEIKSIYTFNRDRTRNLIKMVAARKQGFAYTILVMDEKHGRVYDAKAPELRVNRVGGYEKGPRKWLTL